MNTVLREPQTERLVPISISLVLSQTPVYTVCLFTSQLSLVLFAATYRGMARLSCPEWLNIYQYGLSILSRLSGWGVASLF